MQGHSGYVPASQRRGLSVGTSQIIRAVVAILGEVATQHIKQSIPEGGIWNYDDMHRCLLRWRA